MSVWSRLYNGETEFRFVPRWRLWFAISGLIILAGMASLLTRGLNLGIDFEGGVAWETPAGSASVADARDAVADAGVLDARVQELGTGGDRSIRVQAEESDDPGAVTDALAELTGADPSDISYQEVGPSWGEEITNKAIRALIVFLVLITVYIAMRFEWKMAVATTLALVHDILVTVGIYSLFGFPVTPATVIAFLTILGFSIYDGIVVFDRVDENARALLATNDRTYSRMVDDSMNQVLMRTLNTSITSLIPIGSLLVVGSLVLGATTLQEFALALFIGMLSGAYSSIFIASPALALLKEREDHWSKLRSRLGPQADEVAPRRSTAEVEESADDAPAAAAARPRPTTVGSIQARGRKKGRRR
ncbi:MAG TPA: protein translocase subunit SecF [Acidimicrobiia bacterium]|nr:protein translocase subunit SecF [Acidimicrobiia bacterium]